MATSFPDIMDTNTLTNSTPVTTITPPSIFGSVSAHAQPNSATHPSLGELSTAESHNPPTPQVIEDIFSHASRGELSTAEPHNPPTPQVIENVFSHPYFPPSKVGQITFDPHGDLVLVIPSVNDPSAVARFRVNSGTLCLASPVFRAMLGPHSRFKEGTKLKLATIPGGQESSAFRCTPMELSLTDDDPDAFAVILRILHLDFDNIPTAMPLNVDDQEKYKLYEVAIICDKYDMRHVLLFWLKMWTQPYLHTLSFKNIAMSTTMGSRWLFIAYAFGYEKVFNSVSRELVLHCNVDGSGELFLPSGKYGRLDTYYLPQSVIDEISAKRQQAMESIVDAVHNEIERYSNPHTTLCTFGHLPCDAMMLGLLFRVFRQSQIYPEASAVSTKSVAEVKLILQMIEFPEFTFSTTLIGCCQSPLLTQTPNIFGQPAPSTEPCTGIFAPLQRPSPFVGRDIIPMRSTAILTSTTTANIGEPTTGTSASTSMFGTAPSTTATSASISMFGAAPSTTATSASASRFGAASSTTATSASISMFGAAPSTTAASASTSIFGRAPSTTATTPGSPFKASATTSMATPIASLGYPTCSNCQKKYQAPKRVGDNHAEDCSPLPRLKKNLDNIVVGVTGLEYSQFVRKGKDGERTKPLEQVCTDLWSTVVYTEAPRV